MRKNAQPRGKWCSSESTNPIHFIDIELKVKGISTLYDSFRDYVAVEMLDGERKFQTKEFGLQDARKRTTFQSFPPVLHLPLKRQEYDTQRDSMVKVRTTCIPEEISVRS